jgi:hypothetical protein
MCFLAYFCHVFYSFGQHLKCRDPRKSLEVRKVVVDRLGVNSDCHRRRGSCFAIIFRFTIMISS